MFYIDLGQWWDGALLCQNAQLYLVLITAILSLVWALEYLLNLKKNTGVWALPKTYWKQICGGEAWGFVFF